MSYLQETAIEPQHAFSSSTSPNELPNQQSRRGSLLESQQSRGSNQNVIGHSPTEIAEGTTNEFHANNKYMQDSFETEKRKSNRTYPNNHTSTRKGSNQFSDGIQSGIFADKERGETASAVQKDDSLYEKNEYSYDQIPQEYNPKNQAKQTHATPQELFFETQHDYRRQPHNVYESEQYDDAQYGGQQNYNDTQYRSEELQPTSENWLQDQVQETGYQEYDTRNLSVEPLQQQQYGTDFYQERTTKPTPEIRTSQQYQSNMGQKKGNGNITNKQTNMSK